MLELTALPLPVVLGVLAAALCFAFLLDAVKVAVFAHLRIAQCA